MTTPKRERPDGKPAQVGDVVVDNQGNTVSVVEVPEYWTTIYYERCADGNPKCETK
jgi:hypothetical protein